MADRVVPTIDGSPTFVEISLRYIDFVGDVRSDVSIVDAAATDAQIENMVAAMSALARASLYTVRVTQVYAGEMSKGNALQSLYPSAQDHIVYHAKSAAHVSRRAYVPSPSISFLVPGTETPDATNPSLVNMMTRWDVLWAGTFAGVSLRFTQRRDINKKVTI